MDKYKRFYGLYLFIAVILALVFVGMNILPPQIEALKTAKEEVENQTTILEGKAKQKQIVQNKIKQMSDASQRTQKKIFSPIENDLGNDSLFFALYNDVIEMIHSNSIKIKKMDYDYNPDDDVFVQHGKDTYFVCDINLELVSNYVNLGKLIQNIYQYPYYIRINSVEVKPFKKDKRILITNLSLRLYAYTEPFEESDETPAEANKTKE